MATTNGNGSPLSITVETQDHPAQELFYTDRNASTAYIGGVGSGKTTGGVLRAGRHISEWNPGEMGVVVAPTVPMMRNAILPEFRKWGLLDRPGIEFKRSENRIEYPNGSVVVLETANNDRKIERLRAMNLAWAWIDEAAYLPEKVYRILNDRLRVGQYRNVFLTTTPRGFNWVYEEFGDWSADTGEAVGDGVVVQTDTKTAILGTSTRSNPAHPQDYIDRQERQRSGEAYQQEIEGEFVNFEGLVYTWFDEGNHVAAADLPAHFDETVYGLDFGGSVPTALVCLRRAGEDWYVVDEFYEPRVTDDTIAAEASRMYDEHGRGRMYCDHEPRTIEKLSREGIRAEEADKDVAEGIRHVNGLRDQLHVVQDCQHIITEFNQYRYKDGKDEPLKEQDHALDALRYALFSHDDAKRGGGAVIEF
jgi:PBSX family phage terminase large subunit